MARHIGIMSEDNLHNATASLLGYQYQIEVALPLILNQTIPDEALVEIEVLDDISISRPDGVNHLYQVKHKRSNLTYASKDLWNTIHIWLTNFNDSDNVRRVILTTQSVGPKCTLLEALSDSDSYALDQLMEKLELTAKSTEERQPGMQEYLDLNAAQKSAFLESITLIREMSGIEKLDAEIAQGISGVTSPRLRSVIVQRIRERWRSVALKSIIERRPIKFGAFRGEIAKICGQISLPETLPIEEIKYDEKYIISHNDRNYVTKLREIYLPENGISQAVRSYMFAYTNRSRWVREELLNLDEESSYEDRMLDIYRNQVLKVQLDDINEQHIALRLYKYVVLESSSAVRIRESVADQRITQGSWQMLSEDDRINWAIDS